MIVAEVRQFPIGNGIIVVGLCLGAGFEFFIHQHQQRHPATCMGCHRHPTSRRSCKIGLTEQSFEMRKRLGQEEVHWQAAFAARLAKAYVLLRVLFAGFRSAAPGAAIATNACRITATSVSPTAAVTRRCLACTLAIFAAFTGIFHCFLLLIFSQHSQSFSKQFRRLHSKSSDASLPQIRENRWSIPTIRFKSAIFCSI